jgi:hypothetical protein
VEGTTLQSRRRGGRGWLTEPDGSAEEKGVEGNMSRALRLLREGPSKKMLRNVLLVNKVKKSEQFKVHSAKPSQQKADHVSQGLIRRSPISLNFPRPPFLPSQPLYRR